VIILTVLPAADIYFTMGYFILPGLGFLWPVETYVSTDVSGLFLKCYRY